MRRIIIYSGFSAVLLGVFVALATAGPASRASVSRLSAAADAIIVGPVQALTVNGTVSATIVAERVLKGAIMQGTSIPVAWTSAFLQSMPRAPAATGRPSTGYGIFFLQRNASGSWSLLPITNGDAVWEETYIHALASAPQGLRDLVSAGAPPSPSALDNVLVEMLVNVEAGAPVPSEELTAIFRENKSPVLVAAFTRFLSKQDVNFVCIGLRGSLLSGDPSVISMIQQRYATLASARTWPALLDEIKRYYVNTAPQTIQTLGQIAADTSVGADLRTAAAGALVRMHPQQSLPYLAQLLSDKDGTLRTMAVGGLAMFANNVPIGSHGPAAGPWPYRTDDTIAHSGFAEANVSFWQNWWQQNQSALAQ